MTQLMPLHPLTPLLTDSYPRQWFSVYMQVLQVIKWKGRGLWYPLAMTRHCVYEDTMMDAFK